MSLNDIELKLRDEARFGNQRKSVNANSVYHVDVKAVVQEIGVISVVSWDASTVQSWSVSS